MSRKTVIYTCYGCPYYYTEKGQKYPSKHCGKDHLECPYYLGKEVGGVNVGMEI